MTWYLISFDAHAMDDIPDEDMPAVAKASHAVVQEAIGGISIVDVYSREEALEWAAKIAVACRCAPEVREFMADPKPTRSDDAGLLIDLN